MLKRKQYCYTLLTAAITFFIVFAVCYVITSNKNTLKKERTIELNGFLSGEKAKEEPISIKPYTKITLALQGKGRELLKEAVISADVLLGMTEDEVKERFKDYTVQTFSETEVKLVRVIDRDETEHRDEYVLGIQDHEVCIKSKDHQRLIMKLGVCADDFSSYTYSLLLKESIVISETQKEALLADEGTLEQILQNGEEE